MVIPNISATNQPSPVSSTAATGAAPPVGRTRSSADPQAATIVTLSAQARKLSLTQGSPAQSQMQTSQTQSANRADKAAVEKIETGAREAAEAPANQQSENTNKRGGVNTYA